MATDAVRSQVAAAANDLEVNTKNKIWFHCLLGHILDFQTRLFSLLPPSFPTGFKNLCACLLAPPSPLEDAKDSFSIDTLPMMSYCDPSMTALIWEHLEVLGFIDRYESIIASVGFEFIEKHVLKTCTGEWTKQMLEDLRIWMSGKVVP